MKHQFFLAFLFFLPIFSWSNNQVHNAVQCTDISPIHYWVESTWNQIILKSVSTHLNLDVWISPQNQNDITMITYEKLSSFVTKCEVQFSNLNEWQNYRDFHLKSLEGE